MLFEVDKRSRDDGRVFREPTTEDFDRLAEALRVAGAEAVGVCFLHGYANGANAQLVADALSARLGVPVCTSHEVAPQIREYPRMVNTACHAAPMPLIGPYLEQPQARLGAEGLGGQGVLLLPTGGVPSADRGPPGSTA